MSTERKVLLKLYETMVRIRTFEQRAEQLFLEEKILFNNSDTQVWTAQDLVHPSDFPVQIRSCL